MNIVETGIKDLVIIEPQVFGDDRGFFMESYNKEKFHEAGLTYDFVQDNHSFSTAGVLRGLHFQLPEMEQAKLVRCTRGKLWDVAVDLRKDSPTYKQWFGVELSAENKKQFMVPAGFAHGFYALEDCELQYKCTNVYSPEHDGGIAWNDPEVGIEWPIVDGVETIFSEKDQKQPLLSETDLPW